MIRKILTVFLLIPILSLNGCVVGYRNYPRQQLSAPNPDKKYPQLYYYVEGTSLAGGYLEMQQMLRSYSPFENAEERAEIPKEGVYIKAVVQLVSPSITAAIFGYISYATLTLLPAWSAQDGAEVRFEVYHDAKLIKTFNYGVRRAGAVWLGLLPFAWLNFITANEREAFKAITKQFFEDAKPYFKA